MTKLRKKIRWLRIFRRGISVCLRSVTGSNEFTAKRTSSWINSGRRQLPLRMPQWASWTKRTSWFLGSRTKKRVWNRSLRRSKIERLLMSLQNCALIVAKSSPKRRTTIGAARSTDQLTEVTCGGAAESLTLTQLVVSYRSIPRRTRTSLMIRVNPVK